MDARPARPIDAAEIVRLASVMFESMGVDATASDWLEAALRNVQERLDDDLAVFVVDDPLVWFLARSCGFRGAGVCRR
jgi:hypothetical protein